MVSINPESKSRAVNREVLSELIKLHGKASLGGKLPAYDGRKSLYTAGSLPFESEEYSVTLVDPEKKDKEKAEREYKITIRIAGRTDLYHLQQFLKGRQRDMPQETIQVLDVVLRESPSWNYVTVSRSFFSTTFGHRGDIGEGLECWRGYYQSLRPTQMGLSLNIDISATSFFKPVTVVQFVLEFLNLRDASRPLTDRDRVKIKKALRGVRVETNHQQDQIRRYKITGITPVPMSQLIFPVDERGTRMSVVQYFMQRYDYKLQYTTWPCLQSGSDARPVYLPMEACKIVEGQRYSKKLNDKQVTNILRATCQRPQQREQSIREMVLHNKYAEDKFAQEFGIKVCSDLVSVPARVLPPPILRYHDSGKEKTCAPSVGQWNTINKSVNPRSLVNNQSVLERAFVRNGTPFVSEVPTIIFGADVKHPPPGENSASSNASVVASMDWPKITKYRGLVSAQPHRQEIIEDLFSVSKDPQRGNVNSGMIRELLIAFRRKTGRRPERILFYRDGVSEGQFSHVLLHEMDAIRKACASLEEGYMPPVTFVVVQKRHDMFPEVHGRRDMTDKSGNILPGTVVDLMICHPTEFDFYLCSHAGIQGTSRLTHYHVLYDENHFTADALQSLTKNLCEIYSVCIPGLTVVPLTYLAHLKTILCTSSSYYVEGDGSKTELNIKLLGGGVDDSPALKRPRTESGSSSSNVPIPPDQIFQIFNSLPSFDEYVEANRDSFFVKVTIPDCTIEGSDEDRDDFSMIGIKFGDSVLESHADAHEKKLSWRGTLKRSDIKVCNGRVWVLRPPTPSEDPKDFDKDLNILQEMLGLAFCQSRKKLPYIEEFLKFLKEDKNRNNPLMLPYKRRPLVFMTPRERANALDNVIKDYFRLVGSRQEDFKKILDNVKCGSWPGAKKRHIFKPLVDYQELKHQEDGYGVRKFFCLLILRNHNQHGKILPSHLLDYASVAVFGTFVQRAFIDLLLAGFNIGEALR